MPLKHHRMQLPREVIVGNDALERVGEITGRLGFTNSALVVAGKKTNAIAGGKVRRILEGEEMTIDTLLVEGATLKDVQHVEGKIAVYLWQEKNLT